MGKTWKRNSKQFEDEVPKRNGKNGGGMKIVNGDFEDDYFKDSLEIRDEITVQLTKDNTK